MSTQEEDPISPSSVAAHVVVLVILLTGGCLIEWIKHSWKPPLVTNALLSLGETTMFIYMIGSIGKAFWWTVGQWRSGNTVTEGRGTGLFRQFIPTKMDIANVFKPGKVFRLVVILLLSIIILFLLFEVISLRREKATIQSIQRPPVIERPHREELDRVSNYVRYRAPSSIELTLAFFNHYSLSVLMIFAALGGLTVIGVFSILLLRRKAA